MDTDVWLKRDDLNGVATGGNKVRKIEFLVGEGAGIDADNLVTVGAPQSNHAQNAKPNFRTEEWMGSYAALTHQLGGEFVHLQGSSVARALVDYVHQSLATEVILGHRRRNRWMPADTTSEVIRRLSGVDVPALRVESEVS